MMHEMLSELVQRLKKAGFKVNTVPQEKQQMYTELIVEIADISLSIETPNTYVSSLRVAITFIGSDRIQCLKTLDTLIQVIEETPFTSASTFRIVDIEVDTPGEFLMATMYVEMTEVIEVGSQ